MPESSCLTRVVSPFFGWAVLLVGCAGLASAQNAADSDFALIADGAAKGVVYLAPGSTPTATYAAEELRDHLKVATGAELSIVDSLPEDPAVPVVLVGPSDAAATRGVTLNGLPSEGYRIRSGENWLVLVGDDSDGSPFLSTIWKQYTPLRNGTLTAVYRFLEDVCGMRWYMPGELGMVVPKTDTVVIPHIDRRGAPAFGVRMPRISRENNPKAAGYLTPDGEEGRWLLRAGFGCTTVLYLGHSFLFLSEKHWSGYARKHKLLTTKPHIYAQLLDGSRDFATTSYGYGNLCLSEPDTVTEFVKMMRWWFDHRANKEFSINPNDVWIPCMCDTCLAGLDPELREKVRRIGTATEGGTTRLSLSGELLEEFRTASSKVFWQFVVQVARQIQESHPDRLVGAFGGYEGYGQPDVAGQFDLPSNIVVCITKSRWDFWDPKRREATRRLIRGWSKLTDHVYIWEYYIWNWRGWSVRPKLAGCPVFFPHILQDDIRFQRDNNVRGEKMQNETWTKSYSGLNHLIVYLTGRLLYDPDLDVDDLLDDYYSAFFGAARDEMKAFWEHAEACWMRDTSGLRPKTQAAEIVRTLYPPDDLRLFFELLSAGKAKVVPGSKEARRIALIEEEMAPLKARLSTALRLPGAFSGWTFRPDPEDRGMAERWFDAAKQAGPGWRAADVPAFLPKSGDGPFLGYGWYATTFTVPEEHRGRPIELLFEAVDEQAWVLVNGKPVGEHSIASTGRTVGQLWEEPFVVKVPVSLLSADGRNRLAVRIHNSKSGAGIWKPVHVQVVGADQPPLPQFASSAIFPPPPIDGVYHSEWGGAAIDLGRARVKIAHDPQSLYLTFEAKENGTAPLPSEVDGKGWSWAGKDRWYLPRGASNTIMLEIQPDPDNAKRHLTLLVNASGQLLDAFYGNADLADPQDWKSDVNVATAVNADDWTGTVAIPWKSLGRQLRPGMEIKANISHWRAGKGATYWSLLPADWDRARRRDRGRDRFGIIRFLEQ